MDHFHQLALGVHDAVDILVGHGNFIDDFGVLAALHMGSGAHLVGDGKEFFRLGTAHHPAGPVAAGTE
ncbi:hypothetical protein D3C78_1907820 [compost metagenome]